MGRSWCGAGEQYQLSKPSFPTAYPHSVILCMLVIAHVTQVNPIKQTIPPIMKDHPFLVFWNIPTAKCSTHRGVSLHLEDFGIVTNEKEIFMGDNITIFYVGQLGKYPYYMDYRGDRSINGGVPQNASLAQHIRQMKVNVDKHLSKNYRGLAIIDWEEWRPLYARNWGKKNIYQMKSKELVRKKHPDWSPTRVEKQAEREFDKAGRLFMTHTLRLGQELRPRALWGYYLFPDCYNYHYRREYSEFDGRCPDIELVRNNNLGWLWSQSTALYPSVYLEELLKSSERGKMYVRGRIREAMRVALLADSKNALPVFVYSQSHYMATRPLKPFTQVDLIHTIGESAAMGASGVVLWGGIDFSRTTAACQGIRAYVKSVLGPYVMNVTHASHVCSQVLCSNNGRCYRKQPDEDSFLHLSKKSFHIVTQSKRTGRKVYVKGRLKHTDKRQWKARFLCQCYNGWIGSQCRHRSLAPGGSDSLLTVGLLLLLHFLS